MERVSRSSKYQYTILESSYSHESLSWFSNAQSLSGQLNPFQYGEALATLRDQLKARVMVVANLVLTQRQKDVLWLHLDGYTTSESPSLPKKELGLCRSAASKNCLT